VGPVHVGGTSKGEPMSPVSPKKEIQGLVATKYSGQIMPLYWRTQYCDWAWKKSEILRYIYLDIPTIEPTAAAIAAQSVGILYSPHLSEVGSLYWGRCKLAGDVTSTSRLWCCNLPSNMLGFWAPQTCYNNINRNTLRISLHCWNLCLGIFFFFISSYRYVLNLVLVSQKL